MWSEKSCSRPDYQPYFSKEDNPLKNYFLILFFLTIHNRNLNKIIDRN